MRRDKLIEVIFIVATIFIIVSGILFYIKANNQEKVIEQNPLLKTEVETINIPTKVITITATPMNQTQRETTKNINDIDSQINIIDTIVDDPNISLEDF